MPRVLQFEQFEATLNAVRMLQRRGRPRRRPRWLTNDKVYSYPTIRRWLRRPTSSRDSPAARPSRRAPWSSAGLRLGCPSLAQLHRSSVWDGSRRRGPGRLASTSWRVNTWRWPNGDDPPLPTPAEAETQGLDSGSSSHNSSMYLDRTSGLSPRMTPPHSSQA